MKIKCMFLLAIMLIGIILSGANVYAGLTAERGTLWGRVEIDNGDGHALETGEIWQNKGAGWYYTAFDLECDASGNGSRCIPNVASGALIVGSQVEVRWGSWPATGTVIVADTTAPLIECGSSQPVPTSGDHGHVTLIIMLMCAGIIATFTRRIYNHRTQPK